MHDLFFFDLAIHQARPLHLIFVLNLTKKILMNLMSLMYLKNLMS